MRLRSAMRSAQGSRDDVRSPRVDATGGGAGAGGTRPYRVRVRYVRAYSLHVPNEANPNRRPNGRVYSKF